MMRATLIITDEAGKKHTVVDKTLTPRINGKGNTTLLTTGFGVPTEVRHGGKPVFLSLTLQTRASAGSSGSLID